ncbi:MAG: TRAP transporter large permease subunit, partial [Alphaproteobacteria bacterium]|nr:TRAP transporter large permease subunit [Alphaproteobacteria bacterium]
LPGILLAAFFAAYNMITAKMNPSIAPEPDTLGDVSPLTKGQVYSGAAIVGLIMLVLGGIWGGFFTATEAAGVGALAGMFIAIAKGLRFKELVECIIDAGKTSAPIMILLITAGMYSRFLSLADIDSLIIGAMTSAGLDGAMGLIVMVIIWLLLGMLLDSISIILLTVPLFMTLSSGMDPYAFAIFGILAIEAGLLTPPFGLIVYTVKGVLSGTGHDVPLNQIFSGSIPYWIMMLIVMILVVIFPGLASWLTTFV